MLICDVGGAPPAGPGSPTSVLTAMRFHCVTALASASAGGAADAPTAPTAAIAAAASTAGHMTRLPCVVCPLARRMTPPRLIRPRSVSPLAYGTSRATGLLDVVPLVLPGRPHHLHPVPRIVTVVGSERQTVIHKTWCRRDSPFTRVHLASCRLARSRSWAARDAPLWWGTSASSTSGHASTPWLKAGSWSAWLPARSPRRSVTIGPISASSSSTAKTPSSPTGHSGASSPSGKRRGRLLRGPTPARHPRARARGPPGRAVRLVLPVHRHGRRLHAAAGALRSQPRSHCPSGPSGPPGSGSLGRSPGRLRGRHGRYRSLTDARALG